MAIVSLEADARLTRDPRGEPEARAGPFLMLTAALNDECTACMRGLPDRGSREGDVRLRVAGKVESLKLAAQILCERCPRRWKKQKLSVVTSNTYTASAG